MLSIKKIISKSLGSVRQLFSGFSYYWEDYNYFRRTSKINMCCKSLDSAIATLAASYHVLEKGLSMPNRRLGFGRERLLFLINECQRFYKEYGLHSQLSYSVAIVKEYDELHKKEGYPLEPFLQGKIDELLEIFPEIIPAEQETFTKIQYFADINKPFDVFSASRHSMRHFAGGGTEAQIHNAVDLAKNAPSACNKQPVRVYLISEKEKVRKVLDMQQGNRGFGQDIDKVLIVTTQYSGCTRYSERYMPFMDAGIFTMNLLYSLHFNEVGAIPLVWLNNKKRDKELRTLSGIPYDEIPAIIIGVGDVSDSIICAISPRLETNQILK